MGNVRVRSFSVGLAALIALAGCDENGAFLFADSLQGGSGAASAGGDTGRTVEREVEAPDVFSVTEPGLWDGRPTLGGVWVAHPDVDQPERVIIRNPDNGRFVVGALFRRERERPGPRLDVSFDAATDLGMLAGAPVTLNVTALRREEVSLDPPAPADVPDTETVAVPTPVDTAPLDPIAAAGAALDDVDAEASAPPVQTASTAPVAAPSTLTKPFLQVGIFAVQANADRTATRMRNAGMVPTIRKGEINGKPFWRVIVGPAADSSERTALLGKIRSEGFTDAYPVTN